MWPLQVSWQVLKIPRVAADCELITSLYDALRWFIKDLFTDTQSCRLLMSVPIYFAAPLLKMDTGIFFFIFFSRYLTPLLDQNVVKMLPAFTRVAKNIFCLFTLSKGVCWAVRSLSLFQKSPSSCWNLHLIFRISDLKRSTK